MSNSTIDCYVLPTAPMPSLLPVECVADVVTDAQVSALEKAPANWMKGHLEWRNQRIPILSYSALHDPKLIENIDAKKPKARMVVLNPIPNAARQAYSCIVCFGAVEKITVSADLAYLSVPEDLDKRYIEAVVTDQAESYMIPRLNALGVAFSYF